MESIRHRPGGLRTTQGRRVLKTFNQSKIQKLGNPIHKTEVRNTGQKLRIQKAKLFNKTKNNYWETDTGTLTVIQQDNLAQKGKRTPHIYTGR